MTQIYKHFLTICVIMGFIATGCTTITSSAPMSEALHRQTWRSEVYRIGTVVGKTSEGVQIALNPSERLVIQEKGLAGEIVQEFVDLRDLLPIRVIGIYVEGEAKLGVERPKLDITERTRIVVSTRNRLVLNVPSDLHFDDGQQLFFRMAKIRLAIVNITAGDNSQSGIWDVIQEDLTTILTKTELFTILERAKIKDIFSEYQLASHDLIDPKTAPKIGHLLGAEAIMTGTILQTQGKAVANIRVVDVERGEVLLASRKEFQSTGKPPKIARTIPADGATNVPSSLKEIVIIFDQPMAGGFDVGVKPSPNGPWKVVQNNYWRDKRTWVIKAPSGLLPNQTYSIHLNARRGNQAIGTDTRGFRGLDQEYTMPAQHFFFTTGR